MNTKNNDTVSGERTVTTYHEVMVGNTLFRVTSVYRGQVELRDALENLTVSKALRHSETAMEAQG